MKKGGNMRKIINDVVLDPKNFQPIERVIVKENGQVSLLHKNVYKETPLDKYTAAQRERIIKVNAVLEKNGMSSMTDEEIDYMLDPIGNKLGGFGNTPEELQFLAGFKVEKRIVPIDSSPDSSWFDNKENK